MERLSDRYEQKLRDQRLADPGDSVFGERDADISWNRSHPGMPVFEALFSRLNITSLLFSRSAQPYRAILDALLTHDPETIFLKDNETRLFLHDIPVVRSLSATEIEKKLKHRKCVIVKNRGIITSGTVSPEQTFINFSSALFSCFVKYFSDFADDAAAGRLDQNRIDEFRRIWGMVRPLPALKLDFMRGPFASEETVLAAMAETGRAVVGMGLVDSVMGNISYRLADTLYISQTGSFLDALEGAVDACPLDRSACTGLTASSELPTHMRTIETTPCRAILHGHPRFAVIMSLICDRRDTCEFSDQCHTRCPERRFVGGVPVVCGETGTGRNAFVNTVPPSISGHGAAIVYGHGVFAAGKKDFNTPFSILYHIEQTSRQAYLNHLAAAGIK